MTRRRNTSLNALADSVWRLSEDTIINDLGGQETFSDRILDELATYAESTQESWLVANSKILQQKSSRLSRSLTTEDKLMPKDIKAAMESGAQDSLEKSQSYSEQQPSASGIEEKPTDINKKPVQQPPQFQPSTPHAPLFMPTSPRSTRSRQTSTRRSSPMAGIDTSARTLSSSRKRGRIDSKDASSDHEPYKYHDFKKARHGSQDIHPDRIKQGVWKRNTGTFSKKEMTFIEAPEAERGEPRLFEDPQVEQMVSELKDGQFLSEKTIAHICKKFLFGPTSLRDVGNGATTRRKFQNDADDRTSGPSHVSRPHASGKWRPSMYCTDAADLLVVWTEANHHTLLWVNFDKKSITCLDSFKEVARMKRSEAFKSAYDLILHQIRNEDGEKWEFVEAECPQQNNGYDCGIFVIAFALSIAGAREVPSAVNATQLRKVLSQAVQGRLISAVPLSAEHSSVKEIITRGSMASMISRYKELQGMQQTIDVIRALGVLVVGIDKRAEEYIQAIEEALTRSRRYLGAMEESLRPIDREISLCAPNEAPCSVLISTLQTDLADKIKLGGIEVKDISQSLANAKRSQNALRVFFRGVSEQEDELDEVQNALSISKRHLEAESASQFTEALEAMPSLRNCFRPVE